MVRKSMISFMTNSVLVQKFIFLVVGLSLMVLVGFFSFALTFAGRVCSTSGFFHYGPFVLVWLLHRLWGYGDGFIVKGVVYIIEAEYFQEVFEVCIA